MNTDTIENAKEIISSYKRDDGKKLRIMEVCGTHTHEIFRLGIRKLLPESVELISGPGCPVCVTPIGFIDEACMLALEKGAVICTFGDLIRVPGTEMSLAGARSKGATIKTVYSPLDAVSYAESHRDEQVVFLAVGFETTTPSACLAVEKAKKDAIAEYEKNNGLKDGKPIKPAKKTKKTTESEENEENEEEDLEGVPASLMKLFKAQQKQISELTNSVTTLTGNITTSSKQASAKVLFDNAKLPEKWFKRIDVNSEISVEDQIKELAEEYAEIRQSAVTDEIENGNYTPQSQVKDRSEKEWLDIMNKEEGTGESSGVASLGIE